MGQVKWIRRTWKRDNSVNDMTMEAACNNLEVNSERKLTRKEIARLLTTGITVSTPLAKFKMA